MFDAIIVFDQSDHSGHHLVRGVSEYFVFSVTVTKEISYDESQPK